MEPPDEPGDEGGPAVNILLTILVRGVMMQSRRVLLEIEHREAFASPVP
jgi:hypothetical protein